MNGEKQQLTINCPIVWVTRQSDVLMLIFTQPCHFFDQLSHIIFFGVHTNYLLPPSLNDCPTPQSFLFQNVCVDNRFGMEEVCYLGKSRYSQ